MNLDSVFRALSDETRRAIVRRLAKESSCTVSELAEPFDLSFAAVSKHLRVLEEAGVVVKRRDGRTQRCRLDVRPLDRASKTIEEYRSFWRDRLDALERYLEDVQESGGKKR